MSNGSQDWSGLTLAHGRYAVVAKLGEGGMGAVYRAQDQNIESDVVIKVPLRSMLEDAEFASRFTREIRSLVKLSHPRIVKVTDVGEHEGLPFAVMQYLPGGSLEDRQPIGVEGVRWSADPSEVSGWIGGIAEALDYVHSQGYVHRDVKPGNILFDAHGNPFLGDFGVVKVVTSAADANPARASMTGAGMLLGTPEYMAPELVMGESVDGLVDQYALAVTVYEMLAGRRPFEEEVKTKLLVLHTSKLPPRIEEVSPWVTPALAEAVHRGLAKDPGQRYTSCVEMARGIVAAIEADYVGRPARIRIRCRSCGRGLGLSPADFAKMKQSNRRVACPTCKAPTAGGAEGTESRPTSATETRRPTVAVAAGAAGSTVAVDRIGAAKTVAVEVQGKGATVAIKPQGQGQTVALNPRASTQKIESPGMPGAKRSGTMIVGSPFGPEGIELPNPLDESLSIRDGTGSATAGASPNWPIIGGGVAASLVVLGLVVWSLKPAVEPQRAASVEPRPSSEARPTPAAPPAAPAALPAVASTPASTPVIAVAPPVVEQIPDQVAAPEGVIGSQLASKSPEATLAGGLPSRPEPPKQPPTLAEPPTVGAEASTPEPEDSPTHLKKSVELETILASPQDYWNKTVVLTDAYCIASAAVRRDGWTSLGIIQGDLDLQFNGGKPSLRVGRWASSDLAVDPALVRRLVNAQLMSRFISNPTDHREWGDKVALVTVLVKKPPRTDMPPCQIVKLEVATRVAPEIVTIARKRRYKVVYQTLTISATSEETGTGKDEDWAPKTGRLRHITTQFNKLIDLQKRMANDAKWNQFGAQFNNMLSQGIQNAARQNNAVEARGREMITPPGFR